MRLILPAGFLMLALGVLGFAGPRPPDQPRSDPADGPASPEGIFGKMPVVEAATLHSQTLEEAPASVTVVSADEIRKYGYRTLGEALGSVRGFYFTNDRMYDYSGVRGIAIPGDYNSRFLVMLNSHPLTENIYNSNNFFGQDFGLDMDLVERIEVIRGPNSALFGTNGMLATINIVTKSPVDHPPARASIETGSFGEKKVLLSSSLDLGRGANLLISASAFNNGGRTLDFPGPDAGEPGNVTAHNVDRQKGYHTFANLIWGRWSFTGYFNSRDILVPVGGGGTLFDSQGQWVRDSRNFAGVSYTRDIGRDGQIRWQLNYDQYRYNDRFDYLLESGEVEDNRTGDWGDWVNTQLTYSRPVPKLGTLTLGLYGDYELRNRQINEDVSPAHRVYLNVSARDRSGALFAQQEWSLTTRLKAYAGLRLDASKNYGSFASPRLALVWQPSGNTSYKVVYGRPFRNASAFERYYDDGLAYVANPSLTRETAHAFEASVERKLRKNLTALVNAYHYRIHEVIEGVWISNSLYEYQNTGARWSTGVEFEARGNAWGWIEAAGSFVVQRAVNPDTGEHLANSPGRLGKARMAVPILRNKVYLSGGIQYLSARSTKYGALLRPVALGDVTLSTRGLFRGYDLVLGVRNALNWQYDQPVDLSVDRIRANGRTFFAKLIWRLGE